MRHWTVLTLSTLLIAACGSADLYETPDDEASPQSYGRRAITEQCFSGVGPGGQRIPLTKIIHELRATASGDRVDVLVIFNRDFVDLTYGANAIGWDKHKFKDLRGSDHVELALRDDLGDVRFQAKIDLLSEDDAAPSGYSSQGVAGGDGKVKTGSESHVISHGTSLADNFNEHGYLLIEDSPETSASYAINPAFPNWNFFVEYRLTVDAIVFGSEGFGDAFMASVHASPSKLGQNTIEVEEEPCPESGTPEDPFPDCEQEDCLDPPGEGGEQPDEPGEPDEPNPPENTDPRSEPGL